MKKVQGRQLAPIDPGARIFTEDLGDHALNKQVPFGANLKHEEDER
jgi:hypothetical protein